MFLHQCGLIFFYIFLLWKTSCLNFIWMITILLYVFAVVWSMFDWYHMQHNVFIYHSSGIGSSREWIEGWFSDSREMTGSLSESREDMHRPKVKVQRQVEEVDGRKCQTNTRGTKLCVPHAWTTYM